MKRNKFCCRFFLTASTFGNNISPWESHDGNEDARWFLDAAQDTIDVREISVCNTPDCILIGSYL